MARSQEDGTHAIKAFLVVLANEVGHCGGGQMSVLPDDHVTHSVSHRDLDNLLDSFCVPVATIARHHERRVAWTLFRGDRVKD